MFGSAFVIDVKLKSYVPGRWHISHRLSTAGYGACQKPFAGDCWCQLKSTPRFSAPWMACTKSFWFADQALLVRFGLWHQLQVAASLRWPAWKSGPTPSETWQAAHFEVATMLRRAVKPVATLVMSRAGTTRPPCPPERPGSAGSFAVYGYARRFVCVSGWLWLTKFGTGAVWTEPRL